MSMYLPYFSKYLSGLIKYRSLFTHIHTSSNRTVI